MLLQTSYTGSTADILDWSKTTWNLTNMVEDEISGVDFCEPTRPGHVLFPEPRNITEIKSLCNHMKGEVSVVKNQQIEDELFKIATNSGIDLSSPHGE